jgi:hypothetical protein
VIVKDGSTGGTAIAGRRPDERRRPRSSPTRSGAVSARPEASGALAQHPTDQIVHELTRSSYSLSDLGLFNSKRVKMPVVF